MFVVSVTQTACLHQYFQRAFDFRMKIKTSLTSIIYNKSLVLSNETKQESSTGDIVNLMSVDVQRLQDLVQNLQIMYRSIPNYIMFVIFTQFIRKGYVGRCRYYAYNDSFEWSNCEIPEEASKAPMKNKDERSRLISEILNNIKSLKLYGWEHPYLGKLSHVRNEKELRNLKTMGVFGAVSVFTWNLAPFSVSCFTFSVFLLFEKNKTLLTDIVFPALALFNLLSFPLSVVPMVITNIVEAQVALSRLTKFLTSSEIQTDAVIKAPRVNRLGDVAVSVKDGTFLWSKNRNDDNYKVALSRN